MQRLRVTVLPILLGLCASLFTLVANMPTADACSMMPPQLEVSPTSNLQPGDWIKVQGYGFYDAIAVPIVDEYDPVTGEKLPQHSCMGIEHVPQEVTISWVGSIEEPLTHVKGPEFAAEIQVPAWAEPGWAAVQAGWVMVEVQVGETGPEPCPLFDDGRSLNAAIWPDHCPPPCLEILKETGDLIYPPCPEPCNYLHDQAIRPACPEPCLGGPAVDVWCPEPCPVYLNANGADGVSGDPMMVPPHCPDPCLDGPAAGVWCPEPCPVYLTADDVRSSDPQVLPPHCPEPCLGGPAIDVWCPEPCQAHVLGFEGDHPPVWPECPPEPCFWPLDDAAGPERDLRPDVHCPEPCSMLVDPLADAPINEWRCPAPCPGVDPAILYPSDRPIEDLDYWCPPGPCLFGPDGIEICPVPLPEPWPQPIPEPLPEPLPIPFPHPCIIDPDGNEHCVVPAGETGTTVNGSTSGATTDSATATVPDTTAVEEVDASTTLLRRGNRTDVQDLSPLPAAPRIDFDGCRSDGENACVTVLQERSMEAIRSVMTALFDW